MILYPVKILITKGWYQLQKLTPTTVRFNPNSTMGGQETLILCRKNHDNFGLANVYNLKHKDVVLDCLNRLEIIILLNVKLVYFFQKSIVIVQVTLGFYFYNYLIFLFILVVFITEMLNQFRYMDKLYSLQLIVYFLFYPKKLIYSFIIFKNIQIKSFLTWYQNPNFKKS